MPSRRNLVMAIAVSIATIGCGARTPTPQGSGGAPSGAGTGQSSSGPGGAELAAAILHVQPVLAQTGEVSGEIGPDAPLVLETVGPNGAKFRAEFAAGATAIPVTVTMRPLASVGGLAGDVEGVVFEPAGTLLIAPAVLTIDGPVGRQANARAFGYQAHTTGGAAFPEIAAPTEGPLRIIISHFSGYGATSDSPQGWNIGTISAAEASELIELERFVIANAYSALKAGHISEELATETINNAMQGISDATKRLTAGEIKRAETGSPDAATQVELMTAVAVILASERASQLVGREGSPETIRQVVAILDAYEVAITKRCESNHDLTLLTLMFSLSRQLALLGADNEPRWRGCLSAEVRFRTTITQTEISGEARYGVIMPVTLLFGDDPPPEVPYSVASTLSLGDEVCSIEWRFEDGTLSATRARLIAAEPTPPPAGPGLQPVPPLDIVDASVELLSSDPLVHDVLVGECPDTQGASTVPLDSSFGALLYPDEWKGGGRYVFTGGYTIPGAGSPVLAKRTIERETIVGPPKSDGSRQSWNATTVIEIVHTPK